ncbi:MAG: Jag N-terminal domain-containing protein, partial [Lachnospiraceae bacterium]
MNEVTITSKTLDDAITEASIQLGISSDQMEYDIIERGSAGFLGFGSKKAVIKARLKSESKKPKEAVIPQPAAPIKEKKFSDKKEVKSDIKSDIKS